MKACVGCGAPVRAGTLDEDEECMFSEAFAGRYLYCQKCFDEADER